MPVILDVGLLSLSCWRESVYQRKPTQDVFGKLFSTVRPKAIMKIHVQRNIIWRRPLLSQRSSRAPYPKRTHTGGPHTSQASLFAFVVGTFHHLVNRPPDRQNSAKLTPCNDRVAVYHLPVLNAFASGSSAAVRRNAANAKMTWQCSLKGKISDPARWVAFDMTTTTFWVCPSSVKPAHLVCLCGLAGGWP